MKLLLSYLAFLLSTSALAQEVKLKITPLTKDFYVFTTWRPFNGVLFPANGMYAITTAGAILIDTPWDTTQLQPLTDSIRIKHNAKIVMALATHSHDDRTGGLEFMNRKGVLTFTSHLTDSICVERGQKRATFHFQHDTLFTVGQYSFHAYFPGAGHTRDNLVVWFPEQKILYGGCLVKSTEAESLGYIAEADLQHWPVAIDNLRKKFRTPAFIIPGHQGWSDTSSLIHTLKLLETAGKKE